MLTDFDGTLAPVVADPLGAEALPGTAELLRRLARRYAVVAVVSGRPVDYLQPRLGGERVLLSGLYGLEGMAAGERVEAEGAGQWAPVVADVVAQATERFGALVEDKGLSLTIHFRTAPEREAEVRSWASAETGRSRLVVRPAKASVELHPPMDTDKGTVVESLATGLDAVCFLGDDVGDLPAFAALDRLAAYGVHAVRVAVRTVEAPALLLERADLVVDGPEGAYALLEALDA